MTHKVRSLDPFLSFAYGKGDLPTRDDESQMQGFVRISSDDNKLGESLKIVTLGGSTTTPYFLGNWPRHLCKLINESGRPVTVYNGGVNGYSTNQELLKLIRDVQPLKPDIVISLSGINDVGFMYSIRRHPMIHPYTNYVLNNILEKKIRSAQKQDAVKSINYGAPVDASPVEQWERNMRIMSAVSIEFGIRFFAFLQPTLGVGEYTSSEHEDAMLSDYNQERGGLYMDELRSFYEKARTVCENYDYITDIVDVLKDCQDVYYNARHPNEVGYEAIAKIIFKKLTQDKVV